MAYKIIHKFTWYCRVVDLKMKQSSKDRTKYTLVKLAKFDTGEFLCSYKAHEKAYPYFEEGMQKRKIYTIDRVELLPQNEVYHILTWDDVDKGICAREHIGEVQRDANGNPCKFKQIVVFVNFDNTTRPSIEEILDNEYPDVNHPFINQYLEFNNKQFYIRQQAELRKQREREEQEKYDEMMGSMYDSYEERKYSDLGMTEEEKIMSALENGNGENYGF